MTRRVAVLRPEPGNAATCDALRLVGLVPLSLPLFDIVPLAWTPPAQEQFDGLLVTSANALRCAGTALEKLAGLPVFAVGRATAQEVRSAGLTVIETGAHGVAAIAAEAKRQGYQQLLHLAGRQRMKTPPGVSALIEVYDARERAINPADLHAVEGQIALLHSPRAARRFVLLAKGKITLESVRLAALSPAVAEAAGSGWGEVVVAETRNDAALVALARRLAD